MKKVFKNPIFMFVLGALIFGSIGVAATEILASSIRYKETTVDKAIDELYTKARNKTVVCALAEGNSKAIGSKYLCNPGDNVYRYFYVLKVNSDDVELIMDRNITDTIGDNKTMTWNDAMAFFDEQHPGYAIKESWNNVISVDLPDAQTIANATGMNNGTTTHWDLTTANAWYYLGTNSQSDTSTRTNYTWLYNYTRVCISTGSCTIQLPDNNSSPRGYWTKNLIYSDNSKAWDINRGGNLHIGPISNDDDNGVRPVIKVSKSSLFG